jgi:hypothetical protein
MYRGPSDALRRELEILIAQAEAAIGTDTARVLRWIIRSSS